MHDQRKERLLKLNAENTGTTRANLSATISIPVDVEKCVKKYNTMKLSNSAKECDRYLISDCDLLNAENVIDKNKVRRARSKERAQTMTTVSNLRGIRFDGSTADINTD